MRLILLFLMASTAWTATPASQYKTLLGNMSLNGTLEFSKPATKETTNAIIDRLAKSGAICERLGHRWDAIEFPDCERARAMLSTDMDGCDDLELRHCKTCNVTEVRKWSPVKKEKK